MNATVIPTLVRVQDAEGRGPFKPGATSAWVNPLRVEFWPAIHEELGIARFWKVVDTAHGAGMHVGCAVPMRLLPQWFDAHEVRVLAAKGYRLVDASQCIPIASTQIQRLVASRRPLKELPVLPWPALFGCAQ